MKIIGSGVTEIRVHTEGGAFRVLYVATFPEAVYVLHAFQKKTQKTAKADLSLATTRYKALKERAMKKRTYASVWDALEDTPEAAASMRVRAELMIAVQRYVEASGETQAQAAKHLGLTQPRLNDLLRGRIEKFSLDALVNMLARVGRLVTVKVGRAA